MPADNHNPPFGTTASDDIEEWKPVPGWPDYDVSSLGRVRSRRPFGPASRPNLIGSSKSDSQYVCVTLCDGKGRKKAYVAHLVLKAFVGPRPDGMQALHAPDPDRRNNRLDNLRWGTQGENNLDRLRNGSFAGAKLTEADIPIIWDRLIAGETARHIADDYGVPLQLIRRVRQKKDWSYITADFPELPSWRLPPPAGSGPISIPEDICRSRVELWAPIPGWPKYEASSFGRVRSFKQKSPRMLRFREHEEGYWCVNLWQSNREKGFLIQHLVLMAFACPRPIGMEACHGDGDRKNNYTYNLRWDTRPANLADRLRHRAYGTNVKLAPEQVVEIRARLLAGEKTRVIMDEFGLTKTSVRNVANRKTWAHVG